MYKRKKNVFIKQNCAIIILKKLRGERENWKNREITERNDVSCRRSFKEREVKRQIIERKVKEEKKKKRVNNQKLEEVKKFGGRSF